jgi:hypothetical protein
MQFRPVLATTLAAAGMLAISGAAFAQETTTTTTTHTERSAPGAVIGVPGIVGVQIGGGRENCATRRTTHTNDETGSSSTTVRSNCD